MCVQRLDDSLILQFALRIAFRCVLHRRKSQDIRCLKLLRLNILLGTVKYLAINVRRVGCVVMS